jgi:SAM-dependent methyltransferase
MEDFRSRSFGEASVPEAYRRHLLSQLFEPWARDLVRRARLQPGNAVLDVASGLAPVARVAAATVGRQGRVTASDISGPMLALAATQPVDPNWAPIEYLECSASAIEAEEGHFDAVLCQQGLQFFPEREEAVREMRRVVGKDGTVMISTWAAEHPLGLFGPIAETLHDAGVEEPWPGAFNPTTYVIGASELEGMLRAAGLRDVVVETIELDAVWPDADDAVATVLGTPFGPRVTVLPATDQERIHTLLATKLGTSTEGPVTLRTVSNVARGIR